MQEGSPKASRGRRRLWYLLAGGLGVVVVGFLVIYFVVFPTSSPKPFTLGETTRLAGTPSVASGTSASGATAAPLTGDWTIASGSQAGYRVREKLAFLPAESDAVGRTSQIKGSASFTTHGAATQITSASFTVNVYSLKSDRSMRDEKIREIGLESARYPTSTFSSSGDAAVPAGLAKGEIVKVTVAGVLQLHGVSKHVTIPVEMRSTGATLQAVGSITFPWGEFGMSAPSLGGFVNVTEHATMEFELRLARSS